MTPRNACRNERRLGGGDLIRHAENFGLDCVLEVAEELLPASELLELYARLPEAKRRFDRQLNPRVHQLAAQANTLPHRDYRRQRVDLVAGMLAEQPRMKATLIAAQLGVHPDTARALMREARQRVADPPKPERQPRMDRGPQSADTQNPPDDLQEPAVPTCGRVKNTERGEAV